MLGALGALAGSAFGLYQMNEQKREAEKLRGWQEDLSNTAIQRQVADMKKAGINPILAARIGGASTPSGSMPNIPDLAGAMNAGASSALTVARATDAQVDAGIAREALKQFKGSTPAERAAIAKGILYRKAGLPASAGAVSGAAGNWFTNTAKDVMESVRRFPESFGNYLKNRRAVNNTRKLMRTRRSIDRAMGFDKKPRKE